MHSNGVFNILVLFDQWYWNGFANSILPLLLNNFLSFILFSFSVIIILNPRELILYLSQQNIRKFFKYSAPNSPLAMKNPTSFPHEGSWKLQVELLSSRIIFQVVLPAMCTCPWWRKGLGWGKGQINRTSYFCEIKARKWEK